MPRKGEKLSAEHLAKLQAGRNAKKGGGQATAPGVPEDGDKLANKRPLVQPKEATKPMISQQPNLTKKKKAGVVRDVPPVASAKRGVNSSGQPTAIQEADYLRDTSTGASILITNELPGQKQAIKRTLAKKPKRIPGASVDPNPSEKTVDNIPSKDVKSLEVNSSAPFSFQALRQRLLC
jgi:hypothetical protein